MPWSLLARAATAVYAGGMTAAHPTARLSNAALGRLLGLDHTSISRLRRGERRCSIAVMIRIEDLFDWPVREQYIALTNDIFGSELERRSAKYVADRDTPVNHDTPVAS